MGLSLEKIKKFFLANEAKFVLAIGLILVAGVSFEGGYLKGKSTQNSPIIVEKSSVSSKNALEGQSKDVQLSSADAAKAVLLASNSEPEKKSCHYVGSKNSNKYHLPTCRFAKLIKPENMICFSSAEDAAAKSYLPDKGCIK